MLCLQCSHLLLVSPDEVLTATEQFLSTLHVKLLTLDLLSILNLPLERFSILVEATLAQIVSSFLHLDYRAGEV